MGLYDLTHIPEPSQFLVDNLDILPQGKVLDLAMGNGRNAIFLAKHGYDVEGVDISAAAVRNAKGMALKARVSLKAKVVDLESGYKIRKSAYDIIICFNYLQRSLIQDIKDGIVNGGFVVFETYIIDQMEYGRPRNPEHLLKYNELLTTFREFRCLRYREGVIKSQKKIKAVASIIAQKTSL